MVFHAYIKKRRFKTRELRLQVKIFGKEQHVNKNKLEGK